MKAWPLLILVLVLACASYLFLAPAPSSEDGPERESSISVADRQAGSSEDNGSGPAEASFEREEEVSSIADANLVPDEDLVPLPPVIGPAAQLRVRLVDGDGRPAADAHARLHLRLWEFPKPEDGDEDRFSEWRSQLQAHPDADGWVDATIPAGVAVSVNAGGPSWRTVNRDLQRVRAEEQIDLGEIALSPARQVIGQIVGPDGQPVENAQVTMKVASGAMWYGGADWSSKTDPEGNYLFDGIPNGRYQIEVSAQGFAMLREDAIEIPEGGGITEIDLQLEPGRSLRGLVLDENRRPVAGARVFLFTTSEENSWWGNWRPPLPDAEDSEPGAISAADGSFELHGVGEEGSFSVGADAEGHAAAHVDVEDKNAQLVVQLPLHRRLAGKVIDSKQNGVSEATVTLLRKDRWGGEPDEIATVETEQDGSFEFDSQGKGDYQVKVDSTLGGLDAQDLKLERDRTDLVLQLEPTTELVVLVTDDEGNPVRRAQVSVSSNSPSSHNNRLVSSLGAVEFEVMEDFGGGSGVQRSARTDAEGRARFGSLDPGALNLSVSVDGYARYREEINRNGADQEVAVELHRGAGLVVIITGSSGNPVRNLPVSVKDAVSGDEQGERSTDSAGRAVWKDLEPGTYQVAYRPQDAEGGWWSRRNQEETAVDMPIVELEGGAIEELAVQVQDLSLATVFVHRAGRPAGDVKVRLEKVVDSPYRNYYGGDSGQPTDGRGEIELPPVEPGEYDLVVKPSRNAPESRERVSIHAGNQRLEVEVPGGEIRGQIMGSNGGLAGARLSVIPARDEEEDESGNHRGLTMMGWSNSGGGMTMQMGFADEQLSTTRSDAEGRFRFRDVPDGEWTVIARAEGYGSWTSLPISVRGGNVVELSTTRLMSGAVIHGRDLGWEPNPEAQEPGYFSWNHSVHLVDDNGQTIAMTQILEDGTFRFEDLSEGSYWMRKGRWSSDKITLGAGATQRIEIPIEEKEE